MGTKSVDLLTISSGEAEQPFNYAIGPHGSRFFTEIRDNRKIFGIKCPKCKKIYVPPRRVCGRCFKEMEEFVEVGPEGVLTSYTILRFEFLDPETGKKRPVPYGYAFIKFDGADTSFQHFVQIDDESKVKIGARVKPIFEEKPEGKITDIRHFVLID